MARRTPFRQADVKRAVAGVLAAGVSVGQVKITGDGAIVISASTPGSQERPSTPLDQWRQRHAREPEGR